MPFMPLSASSQVVEVVEVIYVEGAVTVEAVEAVITTVAVEAVVNAVTVTVVLVLKNTFTTCDVRCVCMYANVCVCECMCM
jgi:hypothetical protein